jgi:hypothetical protein
MESSATSRVESVTPVFNKLFFRISWLDFGTMPV